MKKNELILSLIKGYILGDGCLKRRNMVRIRSTSKLLLEQICCLLNSFGIWSSIIEYKRKDKGISYELYVSGIYAIKLRNLLGFEIVKSIRKTHSKVKENKLGFLIPIKKISIDKNYTEEVYDVEVSSKKHNLIIGGIVAHNCGLQIMALKIPIIITNFSGCKDYSNNNTATLIEPSGFILHKNMDGIPQFRNKKWAFIEVKNIRKSMRYVLNNSEIIKKKTENAYNYVMENFNYKVVEKLFSKMIKEVYG